MIRLPSLGAETESWFVDETIRIEGAVALRCPTNPAFRWGNLLVLDAPPEPGSRAVWEARYAAAFADLPEVRHATFAWPGEDGAYDEFIAAGYEGDPNVVRVAAASDLVAAPTAPEGFELRRVTSDDDWRIVEELQVADRDASEPLAAYRRHRRQRNAVYRAIERGTRPGLEGGWYLASIDGTPAGTMGLYVRAGLGRFQYVLVDAALRRRGVATAMVHAVASEGFARYGADRLLIMADEGTPADAIYARLGFGAEERYVGACARDRARVRARPPDGA